MPYQEDLREKQVVAVWAGDIGTEGDLSEYLGTPFETDFGFLLDYEDLPEFSRVFSEPRLHAHYNRPFIKSDIRELLAAFAWSQTEKQEAERLCRQKGLDQAKTVVAFPSLRYREELCRNSQAPLQFVGNLPWPDGLEAWTTLQSKRFLAPPFPKLVRRDYGEDDSLFSWDAIIHLKSWKDFATDAEVSKDGWMPLKGVLPQGDFEMSVEPTTSDKGSRPTPEQARALVLLNTNHREIRDAVLDAIYKVYADWRENYYGQKSSRDGGKTWQTGWQLPELYPPEDMPAVDSSSNLLKLICPSGVAIRATASDKIADIRIPFRCRWDEEHGFAVLIHGGKDVEVGDSDLGI